MTSAPPAGPTAMTDSDPLLAPFDALIGTWSTEAKHRLIDELDLMHLNGEKHFYEVKTNVDHVHLACFECGRIEEFTSPLFERLKTEISRQNGFQIRVVRLEVGGRCRRCCTAAGCQGCEEEACCKNQAIEFA